ncbi:hypothetical protein DFJ58DRAFT_745997 [Suillus subalutaceus]|uniref:uncharacterized protein n=1 Tax=Suillus subalutaceus TaxID=48586 RepID=UPI001B87511C|nr:uncharacterized protein DFJ58DRAFT_745997 [Suillus subalutaceus]KAG1852843.1 hypothetical protein DFJ58DRAFT_745997 [Suillus subalutaceus]
MLPAKYQPVLHDDDCNLWQKEPIRQNFKSLEEIRLSRKQVESMLQDTISVIKEDPSWCVLISSWCLVTIGTIPSLDDTPSLFMLREGLDRILQKELHPQPKASQVLMDMDSDSEDNSSEWEDSPSVVVKQAESHDVSKPHKSKLHKFWLFLIFKLMLIDLEFTANDAPIKCREWAEAIQLYFFKYQDLTPTQLQLAEAKAVDTLVTIRLIGASTYQSKFWPIEVKKSSLYQLLCTICAPDTVLELSADHLAASSCKYQWAASFGLILHQWTNSSAFRDPPPEPKSLKNTGGRFLEPFLLPVNLHVLVFFWMRQHLLLHVTPGFTLLLRSMGIRKIDFDPAKLYHKILSELRCIIEETIASRAFLKCIQREAFGRDTKVPEQLQKNISSEHQRRNPSRSVRDSAPPQSESPPPPPSIPDSSHSTSYTRSSCDQCSALPSSEHCVLLLNVKRRTDVQDLFGSLVTCAPSDDCLPLNLKEGQADDPHYVHPHNDLHLQCMAFHPEVYACCKRDIVQMIDVETGKCVGGVIFNAFNDASLQEMCENHKAIVHNPSVQQGEPRVAVVVMGIAHTPLLCGDSEEHIHAIFRHARDAGALLQSVKYAAPHVAKDIKEKSAAAEMNRLGTSGANIFYCSNYLSPQHFDHDASWSICSQLDKAGTADEWNFCYTEWGAYIQTRANTVWWFDSSHLHGTMAPAASVIQQAKHLRGGALSTGNHLTARKRDMLRARAIADMRRRVAQREQWWEDVVI